MNCGRSLKTARHASVTAICISITFIISRIAPPPSDLVIIDCIEFNESLRFIDPVADMAFAAMDFDFRGRRDLAAVFAEAYFQASQDPQGRKLLPLYKTYRAMVRGMVDGLLAAEGEVPDAERRRARERSRAHWLLALGELEHPSRRPGLVLVAGLPGSGKSTLARMLAERGNFELIRSDMVRKELAGLPIQEPTPEAMHERLYTTEWNDRTYGECRRRAESLLASGSRVIIDANFREEHHRVDCIELARRLAVPVVLFYCLTRPEIAKSRLQSRRQDPSDADWTVYQKAVETWEPFTADTERVVLTICTDGPPESVLNETTQELAQIGLDSPESR